MSGCGKCGSSCESCSGCGTLELIGGEITMLQKLGQIPFLPVVRRADDPTPVFPESDGQAMQDSSRILLCLEKKGLISIDFDAPLKGYTAPGYPICGSFALTARGQQVLELLDIHGIQ